MGWPAVPPAGGAADGRGVLRVAGAVLAAGAGARLGAPKAELVVDGSRLLDRAVAVLRDGGCDPVLAVVRAGTALGGDPAPGAAHPVRLVVNPDPARGQRSSLALAVAAAGSEPVAALAVLLVDLPGVGADAVRTAVRAWRPGRIVAGSYRGRRGHPVVMAITDWERALSLAGPDEGARVLLSREPGRVDDIELEGDPADLDTAEDLDRWRRENSR